MTRKSRTSQCVFMMPKYNIIKAFFLQNQITNLQQHNYENTEQLFNYGIIWTKRIMKTVQNLTHFLSHSQPTHWLPLLICNICQRISLTLKGLSVPGIIGSLASIRKRVTLSESSYKSDKYFTSNTQSVQKSFIAQGAKSVPVYLELKHSYHIFWQHLYQQQRLCL